MVKTPPGIGPPTTGAIAGPIVSRIETGSAAMKQDDRLEAEEYRGRDDDRLDRSST